MKKPQRLTQLIVYAALLAACARPSPAPTPAAVAPPVPTASPTAAPSPTPAPPLPSATPAPPTAAPTPSPEAPRYDLALIGLTLIDGTGAPPIPGATIAISAGRVAAAGRAADVPFSPDTPTRDMRGATVLPGFVNAHAHSYSLADDELRAWTRAGVTTVRDLGGPLGAMVERREASLRDPSLPRLVVAGPIVTVPGGPPIPTSGLSDRVVAVRGAAEARAQAAALLSAGVDLIKINISGRTDVRWPELSDAEIRAIVEVARAQGRRVTSHVDRAVALRRAVESGVSDVAHAPRDRIPDDLIALMVEREVGLIPTIDVYEGLAEERGNVEEWRRVIMPVMYDNIRRFAAAGGVLALGDDYGNPRVALGMPLAEIEHWLAAGLTPMQVIVAATRGGALVCGLEGEVGQLLPGMRADLLAVDGDPLTDIAALSRPVLVLRDGQVAFER